MALCMLSNSMQADDVGMDVEITDGPAESGDYTDMVDVVGEGRSADVLQEEDDVGGTMAPMTHVVQDMASESTGGAASVGRPLHM